MKIRNISANTVYRSTKSDKLGLFKIEDIKRGLYIVTISTSEGDFISRNLVGIRTNETAKVAFALEVEEGHEEEIQPVGTATVIASSEPIMYNSLVESTEVPPTDPSGDEQAEAAEAAEEEGDDQGDNPGDESDEEPGVGPPGHDGEPDPSPSNPGN